jgi:hypothetical protein
VCEAATGGTDDKRHRTAAPCGHRRQPSPVVPCPALDHPGLADDPRRLGGHLALRPLHASTGEAAPPGINVTYPHDTDHPVTLDGEDLAAAFQAQVRELEIGGEVGSLTISRLAEPPGTPSECPPTTGWTILTDSGSDAEQRAWEHRLGLTLAWESATPRLVDTESLRRKE